MIRFIRFVCAALFGGDNCVRCGKPSFAYPLCPPCLRLFTQSWASFADPSVSRCRICGKVLLSEIGTCSSCRNAPVLRSTDGVFPLHAYQLWKKSVLFAWKMEDQRAMSAVFARMCAVALRQLEPVIGSGVSLVPVPPRPGKIRARGWDQIDELCRLLRRRHHYAVLPLLERTTRVQQKKLGRVRRLGISDRAYMLKPPRRLRKFCPAPPSAVVLVDDVMTTGATIEACAAQLKRFGVKKVYALTLFAVD